MIAVTRWGWTIKNDGNARTWLQWDCVQHLEGRFRKRGDQGGHCDRARNRCCQGDRKEILVSINAPPHCTRNASPPRLLSITQRPTAFCSLIFRCKVHQGSRSEAILLPSGRRPGVLQRVELSCNPRSPMGFSSPTPHSRVVWDATTFPPPRAPSFFFQGHQGMGSGPPRHEAGRGASGDHSRARGLWGGRVPSMGHPA
jgi:hypothetical protein